MPSIYVSIRTGNKLERRPNLFYWHGRYFNGLIDKKTNALYDDPEDSLADFAQQPEFHSLARGYIKKLEENERENSSKT